MNKKRIMALICSGVMAAGLMAGCGSSSSASSEASEGVSGSSAAAGTSASASGESYDHQAIENTDGDITITMMVSGVASDNDFETQQLPELVHKKWPNVTLEVTKLPDDNYYTSLKTKLASGECPDIILTQPMYAGSNSCYALAEAGYLAPLNDMDFLKNMENLDAVTYDGNTISLSSKEVK